MNTYEACTSCFNPPVFLSPLTFLFKPNLKISKFDFSFNSLRDRKKTHHTSRGIVHAFTKKSWIDVFDDSVTGQKLWLAYFIGLGVLSSGPLLETGIKLVEQWLQHYLHVSEEKISSIYLENACRLLACLVKQSCGEEERLYALYLELDPHIEQVDKLIKFRYKILLHLASSGYENIKEPVTLVIQRLLLQSKHQKVYRLSDAVKELLYPGDPYEQVFKGIDLMKALAIQARKLEIAQRQYLEYSAQSNLTILDYPKVKKIAQMPASITKEMELDTESELKILEIFTQKLSKKQTYKPNNMEHMIELALKHGYLPFFNILLEDPTYPFLTAFNDEESLREALLKLALLYVNIEIDPAPLVNIFEIVILRSTSIVEDEELDEMINYYVAFCVRCNQPLNPKISTSSLQIAYSHAKILFLIDTKKIPEAKEELKALFALNLYSEIFSHIVYCLQRLRRASEPEDFCNFLLSDGFHSTFFTLYLNQIKDDQSLCETIFNTALSKWDQVPFTPQNFEALVKLSSHYFNFSFVRRVIETKSANLVDTSPSLLNVYIRFYKTYLDQNNRAQIFLDFLTQVLTSVKVENHEKNELYSLYLKICSSENSKPQLEVPKTHQIEYAEILANKNELSSLSEELKHLLTQPIPKNEEQRRRLERCFATFAFQSPLKELRTFLSALKTDENSCKNEIILSYPRLFEPSNNNLPTFLLILDITLTFDSSIWNTIISFFKADKTQNLETELIKILGKKTNLLFLFQNNDLKLENMRIIVRLLLKYKQSQLLSEIIIIHKNTFVDAYSQESLPATPRKSRKKTSQKVLLPDITQKCLSLFESTTELKFVGSLLDRIYQIIANFSKNQQQKNPSVIFGYINVCLKLASQTNWIHCVKLLQLLFLDKKFIKLSNQLLQHMYLSQCSLTYLDKRSLIKELVSFGNKIIEQKKVNPSFNHMNLIRIINLLIDITTEKPNNFFSAKIALGTFLCQAVKYSNVVASDEHQKQAFRVMVKLVQATSLEIVHECLLMKKAPNFFPLLNPIKMADTNLIRNFLNLYCKILIKSFFIRKNKALFSRLLEVPANSLSAFGLDQENGYEISNHMLWKKILQCLIIYQSQNTQKISDKFLNYFFNFSSISSKEIFFIQRQCEVFHRLEEGKQTLYSQILTKLQDQKAPIDCQTYKQFMLLASPLEEEMLESRQLGELHRINCLSLLDKDNPEKSVAHAYLDDNMEEQISPEIIPLLVEYFQYVKSSKVASRILNLLIQNRHHLSLEDLTVIISKLKKFNDQVFWVAASFLLRNVRYSFSDFKEHGLDLIDFSQKLLESVYQDTPLSYKILLLWQKMAEQMLVAGIYENNYDLFFNLFRSFVEASDHYDQQTNPTYYCAFSLLNAPSFLSFESKFKDLTDYQESKDNFLIFWWEILKKRKNEEDKQAIYPLFDILISKNPSPKSGKLFKESVKRYPRVRWNDYEQQMQYSNFFTNQQKSVLEVMEISIFNLLTNFQY